MDDRPICYLQYKLDRAEDSKDDLATYQPDNSDAAIGGVTVASGDVDGDTGWGKWEVNLSHTLDAGVDAGGAVAGIIIAATSDNNRVDTNGDGDVLVGEVDTDGAIAGIVIAATSDNNRSDTNGDFFLI